MIDISISGRLNLYNIRQNSKFLFAKYSKRIAPLTDTAEEILIHLNNSTIGFLPQIQKLELHHVKI